MKFAILTLIRVFLLLLISLYFMILFGSILMALLLFSLAFVLGLPSKFLVKIGTYFKNFSIWLSAQGTLIAYKINKANKNATESKNSRN